MKRIIGHIDLDAFFAAVEERDHEWLKNKPIVVGADPLEGRGRGVVATANYRARAYGIRSAMPITHAWQASELAKMQGKPPAEFVGVNGRRYGEVSHAVMQIVRDHVPTTQQTSIDEAYLDLSFTGSIKQATALARRIKNDIKSQQRLIASIGIGPNKLIAKIASDHEKPDGLTVVEETKVEQFLDPLPIRTLPGVGPKTEVLFQQRGIKTISELKQFSQDELKERIGKWGLALFDKARGRDDSPVVEEHDIKSIGEQATFSSDTRDSNLLLKRLEVMCADIIRRLGEHEYTNFRTVVVTVRFANFETMSRSRTFTRPESSQNALLFEAMRLLMPFLDTRENPNKRLIRLIGVRIEKLSS